MVTTAIYTAKGAFTEIGEVGQFRIIQYSSNEVLQERKSRLYLSFFIRAQCTGIQISFIVCAEGKMIR